MGEEDTIKGGKELKILAEKGMALFANQAEDEVTLDTEAAQKFKDEADTKFAALEAEAALLTGKDNKKARTEKSKEASEVKKTPEYIDASKVIKGQTPKNGHFATIKSAAKGGDDATAATAAAPAADEKKDDKKKKELKPTGAAGISKEERAELDNLKNDIISKKKELKDSGMSGGQINKDEGIVAMVKRMNDLKEKENPGCLAAAKEEKKGGSKKKMSAQSEAEKRELEQQIEEYKGKLKSEFGYSAKDIKADPDLMEMVAKLAAIK